MGSSFIAPADLGFVVIPLPLLPKDWYFRHERICQAQFKLLFLLVDNRQSQGQPKGTEALLEDIARMPQG